MNFIVHPPCCFLTTHVWQCVMDEHPCPGELTVGPPAGQIKHNGESIGEVCVWAFSVTHWTHGIQNARNSKRLRGKMD